MIKIFVILILVCMVSSGCSQFDINDPRCPEKEGADCQPLVDREDVAFCKLENRKWIQENCPDFIYVD